MIRSKALSLAFLFVALHAISARADGQYPIVVRGAGEDSFHLPAPDSPVIQDKDSYDSIIVGGGLGGLSAALFLTNQGKRVLIVEKEPYLGGLAAGGDLLGSKAAYSRGAAYWTDTYKEEQKILDAIGLGDFKDHYQIMEPSDSYLWNGKLYLGIWEDETLAELPASFALFKHELEKANDDELIPDQPIEEAKDLSLDKRSAADWIRGMPELAKFRTDDESKAIYERFTHDLKLDPKDPMKDVIGLMDLYCRSALGSTADRVSAVAFANFYISEIIPRYTTPLGTGGAAELIERALRNRANLADIKLSATALGIDNNADGVKVSYVVDGVEHVASGKYAVYAAELKFVPTIVKGLKDEDSQRASMINKMEYAHYSVHGVRTKGHPYRATYDTWTRGSDYTNEDFTDVILGRWMDPAINGYQGMRDFKKDPADDVGIFTIYDPLGPEWMGTGYTEKQATEIAQKAVDRMVGLYSPILKEKWGTHFDIVSVETTRWPYSIHLAVPGHFRERARILRRRFKRTFFADNNIGTPAFEEALFRGHCAANNVLLKLDSSFKQEEWSRCPAEK